MNDRPLPSLLWTVSIDAAVGQSLDLYIDNTQRVPDIAAATRTVIAAKTISAI